MEKRQVVLELLELKGMKRNLERQLRRTKRYLADVTNEINALRISSAILLEERDNARAKAGTLTLENQKLSETLTKTSVLLASEREIRMHAERQTERCQAELRRQEAARRARFARQTCTNEEGLTLQELVRSTRTTLTGTVSKWVGGMQDECCDGIRETEIIPWMLQKTFFLCAEVVQERREEVLAFFRGKRRSNGSKHKEFPPEEESLDPATEDFMQQHMRRHHHTLFPLAGAERRNVVRQITLGLAQSMMASNEWDPSQRDPELVVKALR